MSNKNQLNLPNYGIDMKKEQREISDKDWESILGAKKRRCLTEGKNLQPHLPKGEVQRGSEDMMDCASREPANDQETKWTCATKEKLISNGNIRWLDENGYINEQGKVEFSDAFIAINSGTTKNGNSLKAPWEAVRKTGLIPKKILPLEKWMGWEDYHDPERITQEMFALGLEFLRRFSINYERVYGRNFADIDDLIGVAGRAWSSPVNKIYPRIEGRINHAFMRCPWEPQIQIFDNYIDSVDGDFIKRLATNYKLLSYGYRSIIGEKLVIDEPVKKNNNMALQTIKAKSDIRVFIQNPINLKRLIHIEDKDGSSELDWEKMKEENLITSEPIIIEDSLLASYEIVKWKINGDFVLNLDTNPFGKEKELSSFGKLFKNLIYK